MTPASYESFQQINELCRELLQFVAAARRSEAAGEGSILVYGFISACAAEIRSTAEKRRQMLACTQWEQALDEGKWALQEREHGVESRAPVMGAKKEDRRHRMLRQGKRESGVRRSYRRPEREARQSGEKL